MRRPEPQSISTPRRFLRFSLVGMIGAALQLALLAALTKLFVPDYLLATVIAVELTIIHNFAWHQRFTWRERSSAGAAQILRRFVELNLSTGMISILGNLVLMKLLVEAARLDVLLANLVSVGACSLVNFAVGDRLIFGADQT